MTSENETFAEIAKRVRRNCNAYPLPTAAAEMLKLVRELEAAHGREMKTTRNCDRFATLSDAKEVWFKECCQWFGGNEGCGGTFLKKNRKPDFDKWLFDPFAEGGES